MHRALTVSCVAGSLLAGCFGSPSQDSGAPGGPDDSDTIERQPPAYSLEACPEMSEGALDFASGGSVYSVEIALPAQPEGAPVLFAWHWLGGSAEDVLRYLELRSLAEAEGVIVIAPDSDGYLYEWRFSMPPGDNPDLLLFEDLLACAHAQWSVDLSRVFTTGMSAGGLWSSYLTVHASQWLAASAPLSGGADSWSYSAPQDDIPVLLTWGGEADTYQGYSFHDSSTYFSDELRTDGHFVVECVHSRGHALPPWGFDYVWRFFTAHPKGLAPEPWLDGLPAEMPDGCRIP